MLYAAVFYHHKEVAVVKPLPLNSGQQSVQIQFINERQNTLANEGVSELKKEKHKTVNSKIQKQKNPQQTAIITGHSKNSADIKSANQKLQKSIRATTAKHDAQLKAELFSEQLQIHTRISTPPPESAHNKQTLAASIPAQSHSPGALSVSSEVVAQRKKIKRTIKKKPSENHTESVSTAKNSGVLQEALVVSGNIPTYPKRAILRNQQGRVVVKLTVNISGTAKNTKIITSSGHAILDTAVLDFIARERFMPAHRGTEKVSSQQIFTFRFELK